MSNNVITISGSMEIYKKMIKIAEELSMNGNVVLLPFKDPNEDNITDEAKRMHEELHRQRIDMSDRLFVINKDGYIGKSTKNEILYAMNTKKFDELVTETEGSCVRRDVLLQHFGITNRNRRVYNPGNIENLIKTAKGDMKNSKPVVFMEPVHLKQWEDILSTIPVDSLILCISPTLQHMLEDLMSSIIKYQSLYEKDKCNFVQAGIEIHHFQVLARNLIESIVKILKPTEINFWEYCFDIKSDACENVMKSMAGIVESFTRISNRSIDSLIYLTPDELITCNISW